MNKKELLAQYEQNEKRAAEIFQALKTEKRELNDEERKELDSIELEMRKSRIDLIKLEQDLEKKGKEVKVTEEFRLSRAIRNMIEGKSQSGAEAEAISEARELHKGAALDTVSNNSILVRAAAQATVEGEGKEIITTDKPELLLPFQDALVMAQAGAKMLTGLKGDVSFPIYSGTTAGWKGEIESAADGKGKFPEKTFRPKRITAYVDVSKQLLVQDTLGVDNMFRNQIVASVAQVLQKTLLGKAAGTANKPKGIFNGSVADLGAMSWEGIVGMETSVDTSNALEGNLAYILHPALVGLAKTTPQAEHSASGFIYQGGKINEYNAHRTNSVADKLNTDGYGVVFGNWGDFFIGQWGAVELLVDPYSKSLDGMVRLVVNAWFDGGILRDESFAIGSMKKEAPAAK